MNYGRYKNHTVFLLILLGIFAVIFIPELMGFAILPDEFGYWYNAAKLIGFDWTRVEELGDYYSYGYSIILSPILLLIHDPVAAYRTALCVNLVLLLLSGYFLYILFDKDSYFCILYPPIVIYSFTTMSENSLFLAYTAALMFLKSYMRGGKRKDAVFFILLLLFLFTVHMRTFPLMIAGILLILEKEKERESKKGFGIFLVIFMAEVFCACLCAEAFFKSGIDYRGGLSGTGLYAILGKVKKIFSYEGGIGFLKSVIGTIYYIGTASVGIAYIGIYRIIKEVRQKNEVAYFILVSLIMEVAVSSIFLFTSKTQEAVIYGRYIDFLIPVLLCFGIKEVRENGINNKLLFSMAAVIGICTLVTALALRQYEDFDPLFALNVNYMRINGNAGLIITIGGIICIAALLLMRFVKKRAPAGGVLIAAAVCHIFFSCRDMTESNYVYGKENILLAQKIADEKDAGIIYIDDDGSNLIQVMQFYLREKPVRVVNDINDISSSEDHRLIITMKYDDINDELKDTFELFGESQSFCVWTDAVY